MEVPILMIGYPATNSEQGTGAHIVRSHALASSFNAVHESVRAAGLQFETKFNKTYTVLDNICVFERKVTRVQEEYDLFCRAKEVLSHKLTRCHMHFEPVFEQLCHFKGGGGGGATQSGVWSQVDDTRRAKAHFRVFYEDKIDTPLVLFDDVLQIDQELR
ncbi:hypothetical protein CY34DRAFT_109761 [Suillus luteus UH-Slu-Lm8-n1]|uniref:Uncharacterized protein n=1 Tax=Suillus luteus UH-Slu-Lm8-n1 TaxID=930992 RepID=A0A0D0ANF1_9AGAM|nr:hypothetical protein CY34DRAFT_109761 [Suillus luteus UH-Slu-Lm8-n1]